MKPMRVQVGWSLYPASWEEERKRRRRKGKGPVTNAPTAFRGIPEATKAAVTDLADALGVPKGELVRRLLEYGEACYRAGTLEFELYPIETAVNTLYPGNAQAPNSLLTAQATQEDGWNWFTSNEPAPDQASTPRPRKRKS